MRVLRAVAGSAGVAPHRSERCEDHGSFERSTKTANRIGAHAWVAARSQFVGQRSAISRKFTRQEISGRVAETKEPISVLVGLLHLHARCGARAP